jgi:hypothetical protein
MSYFNVCIEACDKLQTIQREVSKFGTYVTGLLI